jgi:uncharacterized repeat protein (TIGR03803 family)
VAACISAAFLLAVVATTHAQTNYTVLTTGLSGEGPSDVILSGSTLYGTTSSGGSGDGSAYQLLISTNGNTLCPLYVFAGGNDDGEFPNGPLILSGSTFYGTTEFGGNSYGDGTLFTVSATTNCMGTNYAIVCSFLPWEAQNPHGALILSGTTLFGLASSNGNGSMYRIDTDGTSFTNLYVFGGQLTNFFTNIVVTVTNSVTNIVTNVVAQVYSDGADPNSPLLLSGSTLYGTTSAGGSNGLGTVFQINTDGTGYSILHHFSDTPPDGSIPQSGLVLSGSTLYGTTSQGTRGNGTVYQINTDGSGFGIVYEFGVFAGDGYAPYGPLTLSGSTLYGSTYFGGTNSCDCGTIFRINTNGSGYTNLYSFGSNFGSNPQGSLVLNNSTLYGVAGGYPFSLGVPALPPPPPSTSSVLRITSIVQQGNDIAISWTNSISFTNALQGTTNALQGTVSSGYNTNNFVDIFTNNAATATANYTDSGAVTNYSSRFYRVRSLP